MEHQILKINRLLWSRAAKIRMTLKDVRSEGMPLHGYDRTFLRRWFEDMGFAKKPLICVKENSLEVELIAENVWPIVALVSFLAAVNNHETHTILWARLHDLISLKKDIQICNQTLHSGAGEYWFTESEA
jgi:hypothetical protein